jgi:NAD(P)-dependent dehydrogenase (short-subunit alcohol dehydrogenase family)
MSHTIELSEQPVVRRTRDVAGQVVIVTGASSGLGEELARAFAADGAHVVVTARRQGRLRRLVSDLGPDRCVAVAGDIIDTDLPLRLVDAAVDRFGHLDVLVNNAGTNHVVPAEHETLTGFLSVLNVNLVSAFACCQAAFPVMRDGGGGSIVNVASALGMVGIGRIPQAAYCAAKGGLISLSRELAAEWAGESVRVNCVAPGWFPSEMTAEMFDERGSRYIERTVPMGRPGRRGELYQAVAFLAGEGSSYVTGQTIPVDGGWTSV